MCKLTFGLHLLQGALKGGRGSGLLISLEIPDPQRLRNNSFCGLESDGDLINTYSTQLEQPLRIVL